MTPICLLFYRERVDAVDQIRCVRDRESIFLIIHHQILLSMYISHSWRDVKWHVLRIDFLKANTNLSCLIRLLSTFGNELLTIQYNKQFFWDVGMGIILLSHSAAELNKKNHKNVLDLSVVSHVS